MIIPVMSLEKFVALLDERIEIALSKQAKGSTNQDNHVYLSARRTAQLLGISTVTLRRYTREGIITGAYRIKNVVKYRKDEVEKSLQTIKTVKYSRKQQF